MAKERRVTYTLDLEVGATARAAAAEAKKIFGDLSKESKAASTEARNAWQEAAKARNAYERGSGGGGRGGSGGGPSGGGSFGDGMRAGSANLRAERAEREANIREMGRENAARARAAAEERKILADRVRDNTEASRKIREAARTANAEGWRRRQASEARQASELADLTSRHRAARDEVLRGGGVSGGSGSASGSTFSDADARDVVSGMGKQYDHAVRSAKQLQQENLKVLQGYSQIASGIMSGARAAIFFGATNEKSAEAMLKMVLYAEGLVSAFNGVRNVVGGLSKIGAGRAAGGGIGSLLAGGAAGGLSVGGRFAGAGALAIGGLKAGGLLAGAAGGMVGLDALRSLIRGESVGGNLRDGMSVITDKLGFTDTVGDHGREWGGRFANVARDRDLRTSSAAIRSQSRSELFGINEQRARMSGGAAGALGAAESWLADAQARRESLRASGSSSVGEQGVAIAEVLRALETRKRIVEEINETERQGIREQLSGAKQRLQSLQQELSQRTEAYRRDKTSAAAAFGEASPAKQQAALASLRKKQAGLPLSPSDVDALAPFGGEGGQTFRQNYYAERGMNAGAAEIQKEFFGANSPGMQGIREVNAKIDSTVVLTVDLAVKEADLINKYKEAMKPLLALYERVLQDAAANREAVNQMQNQINMQQASAGFPHPTGGF